jgi:hypothetical protein
MKRIKLSSLALALSLSGAIYAAGGFAQSTSQESGKSQPSASCCAKHKANHKQHTNQPAESGDRQESCCASGASCCKDGASCCAKQKAEGEKTVEQACDMSQSDGAGCCKEGASCCTGGSCSAARKQ